MEYVAKTPDQLQKLDSPEQGAVPMDVLAACKCFVENSQLIHMGPALQKDSTSCPQGLHTVFHILSRLTPGDHWDVLPWNVRPWEVRPSAPGQGFCRISWAIRSTSALNSTSVLTISPTLSQPCITVV